MKVFEELGEMMERDMDTVVISTVGSGVSYLRTYVVVRKHSAGNVRAVSRT